MLLLGDVPVDPPLFLAPMAGVTDRDFRLIVRRIGGVGVVTMEFVSSRGLTEGDRRVRRLLTFSDEERPISIQVYGSDPDTMAEAARTVEERGADLCDANMGCPANKILKGCAGARLMGDLPLAERIVAAVTKAVSIPVTVKFRLGLDEGRQSFLELGRIGGVFGGEHGGGEVRTRSLRPACIARVEPGEAVATAARGPRRRSAPAAAPGARVPRPSCAGRRHCASARGTDCRNPSALV